MAERLSKGDSTKKLVLGESVPIRRRITRRKIWDAGTIVAALFLGIAAVLSIVVVFLFAVNYVLFILISLTILIIYLLLVITIVASRKTVSVVTPGRKMEESIIRQGVIQDGNAKAPVIKSEIIQGSEGNFVASTKNKTYHKKGCRLVRNIKPEFKAYSDSPDFFKKQKYKACKICLKRR